MSESKPNPIAVRNFDQISIRVSDDALADRTEALESSQRVLKVQDEFGAKIATRVRKTLYDLARLMESSRKKAKAPVLDLGKAIDSTAAEFSADIKREIARIDKLIAAYWDRVNAEKEAAARAAREAAEAAEKEARRLKAEAEEKFQREERSRLAAAESGQTVQEPQEPTTSFASAYQTKTAMMAAADAEAKAREIEKSKPSEALQGSGMTVVKKLDFEVVDLQELASKHPDLVTISVKRQNVLFALKEGREIAGIRTFEASSTRATR